MLRQVVLNIFVILGTVHVMRQGGFCLAFEKMKFGKIPALHLMSLTCCKFIPTYHVIRLYIHNL